MNEIIASWEYLFAKNQIDEQVKGIINNLMDCDLKMNLEISTLNTERFFVK